VLAPGSCIVSISPSDILLVHTMYMRLLAHIRLTCAFCHRSRRHGGCVLSIVTSIVLCQPRYVGLAMVRSALDPVCSDHCSQYKPCSLLATGGVAHCATTLSAHR